MQTIQDAKNPLLREIPEAKLMKKDNWLEMWTVLAGLYFLNLQINELRHFPDSRTVKWFAFRIGEQNFFCNIQKTH